MIERTEDGHEIEGDGFYTLHCTGAHLQHTPDAGPTEDTPADTTDPRD